MATFACVLANIPVDKTSSSLIQSLNLPSTTQVAAESTHLVVFTNVDSIDNGTCRSTYGGFVLLHLTVCGKLFSAIPRTSVTPTLLSDSVLSWGVGKLLSDI